MYFFFYLVSLQKICDSQLERLELTGALSPPNIEAKIWDKGC